MIAAYRAYARCIERAGGDTIVLSPHKRLIARYVRLIDGLLLTGGDDIHPRYYGRRVSDRLRDISHEDRTVFELALFRRFLRERKPILGVCLGIQTMNVALGGSLILDIPTARDRVANHKKGMHALNIAPKTRLQAITKRSRILVNSRHHQAIDRLAPRLVVSGRSKDGIIEAVEDPKAPFVIGVQWHPEEIPNRIESKKLFSEFIRACRQ